MTVDWKCIKYAQEELCIHKRIGSNEFKNAWIRHFGRPTSKADEMFLKVGIDDFFEDYMTSKALNVSEYFKEISED